MKAPEILPIPNIPDGLREAQQLRRLVPFIGAGVSRLAGCPDWASFADGALDQMVGARCLNHSEVEQLRHLNPRVKLSIARSVSRRTSPVDFRTLLHQKDWHANKDGQRIYSALARLSKQFVTTNYDEWLDIDLSLPEISLTGAPARADHAATRSREPIYRPQEFIPSVLSRPGTVVHLHGSLRDPDKMVLTQQDYVKHYANDRGLGSDPEKENRVLTFLEHLFKEKCVLFLGYGLEELEILEYVMLKARRSIDPRLGERHFVLQGYFSHQRELMGHMYHYYQDECGITLIPFSRDENNFRQLIDVVEHFAENLPASGPLVLQDFKEMESLLHE